MSVLSQQASGRQVLNARARQWSLVLARYAFAVIAIALAARLTHLLELAAPESPNLFLFYGAIVASAWFAGPGPGWLSVVLSIIAADTFFLPPIHELNLSTRDLPWLLAFAICSAATNALSLQRRRAENALKQARDELEARVQERTADLRKANELLMSEAAERTRAETALREAQSELVRASRITTVGELTTSIAHEVNQPLAAVVANSQAALNWLRRTPPAVNEVRESVTATITAAERASAVIGRIRDLATRGTHSCTLLDTHEIIQSVVALVRAELKQQRVNLRLDVETNAFVVADRIELQQLMLNLINNAIDSMSEIVDRPRELSIRARRNEDNLITITVEDAGRGFNDTDTDRIFQPFYSTKPRGMGMGLSICRSIVEALGGNISASSRQPHGAMVCVALPAAVAP